MKKQINKIKTFVKKNEGEIVRIAYYALGAVAGITAVRIANKASFDIFAAQHPEHDFVLKDRDGHFYGMNEIKE